MINLRLLLLLANIGSAQKKEKKKKKKEEEEADRAELSLFRVSEGRKERNKRHRRWIQY